MLRKQKVQVVSITYKIGRKTFTFNPDRKKKANESKDRTISTNTSLARGVEKENEDFKCINGELFIKACIGTSCEWVPYGEPCS